LGAKATFSDEERAAVGKAATSSTEAYAVYLQAWTLMQDHSEDPTIDTLLDRAASLDPDFALVHAFQAWRGAEQLIDSVQGAIISEAEREEHRRRVTEQARRALAIDPNVPYASAALADMLNGARQGRFAGRQATRSDGRRPDRRWPAPARLPSRTALWL
jgi:hypothetical protein